MRPGGGTVEIYRYGPVAWVWRVMAGAGLFAAGALLWLAWRGASLAPLFMAIPLALPGLVLAPMVAVKIRLLEDGRVEIHTLAFWRRRLDPSRLGKVHHKTHAQAYVQRVSAPRIWVSVRGGLPIHVDLCGTIPQRETFRRLFDIPGNWLRRSSLS